jgi:hypothetical protein
LDCILNEKEGLVVLLPWSIMIGTRSGEREPAEGKPGLFALLGKKRTSGRVKSEANE